MVRSRPRPSIKWLTLKPFLHRRSLARLRGADARLHRHERSPAGEPLKERKRLYGCGVSPQHLAPAAPRLAVFLTTSFLLCGLTLMLSVASLYPFHRLQIPYTPPGKNWQRTLPSAVPWLLVISSLLLPVSPKPSNPTCPKHLDTGFGRVTEGTTAVRPWAAESLTGLRVLESRFPDRIKPQYTWSSVHGCAARHCRLPCCSYKSRSRV